MTALKKDFAIEIIPGIPGITGVPGVPARSGYFVASIRYENTEVGRPPNSILEYSSFDLGLGLNTGGGLANTTGIQTLSAGQTIRPATAAEIGTYIPTLIPLMTQVQDDYDNNVGGDKLDADWAKYHVEETRILQAQMDSGQLGQPLARLPNTYGENAFIAAWDGAPSAPGIMFYVFTGFSAGDMPFQLYSR